MFWEFTVQLSTINTEPLFLICLKLGVNMRADHIFACKIIRLTYIYFTLNFICDSSREGARNMKSCWGDAALSYTDGVPIHVGLNWHFSILFRILGVKFDDAEYLKYSWGGWGVHWLHYCMCVINLTCMYFILNFKGNGSAGHAASTLGISHILLGWGGWQVVWVELVRWQQRDGQWSAWVARTACPEYLTYCQEGRHNGGWAACEIAMMGIWHHHDASPSILTVRPDASPLSLTACPDMSPSRPVYPDMSPLGHACPDVSPSNLTACPDASPLNLTVCPDASPSNLTACPDASPSSHARPDGACWCATFEPEGLSWRVTFEPCPSWQCVLTCHLWAIPIFYFQTL